MVYITGEVILPIVTVNNAHHNTGIEHMTQVEIKHSKYGPHRFSNSSDEVADSNSPSNPHHHDNDVSSDASTPPARKNSTHLRVCYIRFFVDLLTITEKAYTIWLVNLWISWVFLSILNFSYD